MIEHEIASDNRSVGSSGAGGDVWKDLGFPQDQDQDQGEGEGEGEDGAIVWSLQVGFDSLRVGHRDDVPENFILEKEFKLNLELCIRAKKPVYISLPRHER